MVPNRLGVENSFAINSINNKVVCRLVKEEYNVNHGYSPAHTNWRLVKIWQRKLAIPESDKEIKC